MDTNCACEIRAILIGPSGGSGHVRHRPAETGSAESAAHSTGAFPRRTSCVTRGCDRLFLFPFLLWQSHPIHYYSPRLLAAPPLPSSFLYSRRALEMAPITR